MGVHNNFPTKGWIKLDGVSVAFSDNVYIVKDFKTNLKYIYWSLDMPNQFFASQNLESDTVAKFLVAVNNKGDVIQVPSENIKVSFDGNSVEALSEHIWGLHEKNKEYGSKFVSIEQDIDGITQTVGKTKEEIGKVQQEVSKVDQKADGIDLSVKKVEKEYKDDKIINEIRENVNKSIISANSSLGIFKAYLTTAFKDDAISSDEKIEIQKQIDIIQLRRDGVVGEVDKVIGLLSGIEGNQDKINKIDSGKTLFVSAMNNVNTLITTAISDDIIVPSEVSVIIDAFAKANLATNTLKNTLDDIILLGLGGLVSEELANIGIRSDEIDLKVSKTEETLKEEVKVVNEKYSQILLSPDGIVNKVSSIEKTADENGKQISSTQSSVTQLADSITSKVDKGVFSSEIAQLGDRISNKVSAGEVGSIIEQSPSEIRYGFNNISTNVRINSSGLEVEKGRIKTEAIEPGIDGRVVLEPNYYYGKPGVDRNNIRSIDCVDGKIRIKRDADSYMSISDSSIDFYVNSGHSSVLSIGRYGIDGVAKYNWDWGSYYTIGDLIGGYGLCCQYPNDGIRIKCGTSDSYASVKLLPYSASLYQGSDIRLKENVKYLNEKNHEKDTPKVMSIFSMENKKTIVAPTNQGDVIIDYNSDTYCNKNISKEDLHDFIKNELKLCEYNYKGGDKVDLNFIAQDIVDTKVGSLFVERDEEGILGYNLGHNYTSTIIGALQVEIQKREQLESKVELLQKENIELREEILGIKGTLDKLLK